MSRTYRKQSRFLEILFLTLGGLWLFGALALAATATIGAGTVEWMWPISNATPVAVSPATKF